MSGSMAWLMVSRTSLTHLVAVPALGDLEDRLAHALEALLVGAEALEPELADAGADQGAAVQQSAGVELGPEGDERRLGDDRLIEVEKGRTHPSMLGAMPSRCTGLQPTKARVQSWVASTRAIKTTWSCSRKCIVGHGMQRLLVAHDRHDAHRVG